ncbi:MAG: FAD-dependent oxidoreductase [Bacteroidetes bacterium MedPE-SWsnd-G2]|nr:MAG: FAD-dependent oxidoreductase [Bacteroidetes bacterium MedPE-SWsnd-G2]
MNLSYWEVKTYLSQVDYAIVGSGIVGLNCALRLRAQHPNAKIIILERGVFPQGASTKNAGFACFGSLSEIVDDLNSHSEAEVFDLVNRRVKGLNLLRNTLGDSGINYKGFGGYELFTEEHRETYSTCLEQLDRINTLLSPIFSAPVFKVATNNFGFKNTVAQLVYNAFEGQIDTGQMMNALLTLARKNSIEIINTCEVKSFEDFGSGVSIKTTAFDFKCKKLFIANNGFASQLITEKVRPARAQVLITKPIKNLKIKGTFHLDKGYYYFRNIDDRVLFGGGRNLDFKTEETTAMTTTALIQNKLEQLLQEVILPDTAFEIDRRWSGIMGVGSQKKSIVKPLSTNVYCGVRLGGMGVAIGSLVGQELADLL